MHQDSKKKKKKKSEIHASVKQNKTRNRPGLKNHTGHINMQTVLRVKY